MNLPLDFLERCYEQLWRIRLLETQVGRLAAQGEVPGFPHLSTGQEAVAVGVCAHLTDRDYLFTSHRGHGHVVAKGSDPYAVFAEILGREEGLCHGRGGSMHLVDAAKGVLGATGVVAGNVSLAAGAAWAAQMRGEDRIAVVFFGDGATGAGVFHETLNLATLWKLPLLLVCENNGYAEFTSREEHSNVSKVSTFAAPYGIAARTVDGNDLLAVHAAAAEAVDALRAGRGPCLLECMTFRMAGHYVGDAQRYRSKEEIEAMRAKDPIPRLAKHLATRGFPQSKLDEIEARMKVEMDSVVQKARAATRPDPASVLSHVYSALPAAA